MSEETLEPPLPPIDARTEAVAERLFGLRLALRKDSTEIIHEEWLTAPEWIRQGCLRQAIEVLTAADQAKPASAKASGYKDRMRVEYRELTARAGRLRDMAAAVCGWHARLRARLSDQPVEQAARRHGRIRQSAPPQSQDRTRQP